MNQGPLSSFIHCMAINQNAMDFEWVGLTGRGREQQVHLTCLQFWPNNVPRSPADLVNHSGIEEMIFLASHGPWKSYILSFSRQIRAGQNAPLHFKRQFHSYLRVNFDYSFFCDSLRVSRKSQTGMTCSFASIRELWAIEEVYRFLWHTR